MTTSVALCTYNGEKYLSEQLDSILYQSVPIDEIIICDDGSKDRTASILEQYEKKYPNVIRIYRNSENLGYVKNFEKALSLCKCDLIFLSDQDDIWYPNKVNVCIQYFKENREKNTIAHNLDLLDSNITNNTFWQLKQISHEELKINNIEILKRILFEENIFPGMSLAITKDALLEYLPLQKIDNIIIHDFELIIKSLRDNKFGIISETLGAYRKHDNQSIGYSETQNKNINDITTIYLLSKKYEKILEYTKAFNLPNKINSDFKEFATMNYRDYLRKYGSLERVIMHLKHKYYHKIINFYTS